MSMVGNMGHPLFLVAVFRVVFTSGDFCKHLSSLPSCSNIKQPTEKTCMCRHFEDFLPFSYQFLNVFKFMLSNELCSYKKRFVSLDCSCCNLSNDMSSKSVTSLNIC